MINIDRINELARKSRTSEGLTPDEKEEQALLRRQYIDAFKRDLAAQLDNTYIVNGCGSKRKLIKKDRND